MADHARAVEISGRQITTARLRLRPWRTDDAEDALRLFGDDEVVRWLAPALPRIDDIEEMRERLLGWIGSDGTSGRPVGRWVVEELESGRIVGAGAVLPLPPGGEDLEIGWQLVPEARGRGLASEAGHALAHFAFSEGEDEVFAVVRPRNTKGLATARRVGMEWVGETEKYYGLRLQVFRLRKGELDIAVPTVVRQDSAPTG